MSRVWRPTGPLDLRATLGCHGRGPGDPAYRVAADGAVWRAVRTPDGPGTLRILADARAGEVTGEAWGPGADWLACRLPALLGADDDPATFRPAAEHAVLYEAARRRAGFRVSRTDRVLEALVAAVLEQKVTGPEAHRSWRQLLWRHGTPAPGPGEPAGRMRVPPDAGTLRALATWDWHLAGVDPRRARTIRVAASAAGRLEEALELGVDVLDRRLRALPGIGVWTAAEVRQRAFGDADAVSVGDLHVPGMIGWALTGRVVDDAGMLALLEPYAGHRYRVQRLLELAGVAVPRRAPRFAARNYRSF